MNELHSAAERYREVIYGSGCCAAYGDDITFEELDDRIGDDRELLSRFAVDLLDPTPLSELTDDQWRELGFSRNGDVWGTSEIPFVGVEFGLNSNLCLLHGDTLPYLRTLGQLRVLMFAMGGRA